MRNVIVPLVAALLAAVLLLAPAELRADILYVSSNSGQQVFQIDTTMTPGGSGTNNPIAGVSFSTPEGLALDSLGNLYVADAGSSPNQVYKLTRGARGQGFEGFGNFTQGTYASGGNISGPQGIAFDSAGRLYVANFGTSSLVQVPAGGTSTGGTTLASSLNTPFSVAVSPINGFIYVGNVFSTGVRVYDSSGNLKGTISTTVGGITYNSQGLTFDTAGNLYISEVFNGQASRVTQQPIDPVGGLATGTANTNYGPNNLTSPSGLAFDQAGNLYITDSSTGNIVRVSPSSPGSGILFASGITNPQFIVALATPEPSSLALLSMAASAMAGCGWWNRRRRRPTDPTDETTPSDAIAPEKS